MYIPVHNAPRAHPENKAKQAVYGFATSRLRILLWSLLGCVLGGRRGLVVVVCWRGKEEGGT